MIALVIEHLIFGAHELQCNLARTFFVQLVFFVVYRNMLRACRVRKTIRALYKEPE